MTASRKPIFTRIRVPIEPELLRKSQALAKKMHISMSALVSRGLRIFLLAAGRDGRWSSSSSKVE